MLRTKIKGTCPHDCPDTCGVITEVEAGKAIRFYGDPDHAVTQGWLCGKVRPYLHHVYHPERLRYPLRRAGAKGAGKWRRISWEEALAEIGERWRGIIAQYGAAAILPYSYSGTMGLVQNWVASGRFFNRLGASQLQRSICGAAAEMAVEMTLGVRLSQPYSAVESSKLVIIWGHNPVSTAPHFMPALIKAKRNGTQVIVIDPRRTKSAKFADWHIAPLPATDGALALGLAHIILREGWHNQAWLAQHTIGWAALKARLADYDYGPEQVAQITGLPVATIETLARRYATQTPSLIKIADGLQRHPNGGQTVRAVLALPALTGQYGVRGGGLSYSTSGVTRWDGETISCAKKCPPPARTVNMNRLGAALLGEVKDPPLKSLYILMANPVASSPNASKIIEGLRREDLFTVVHELFMTDSADYADIVLPATSQLEHADLHKGYGHTFLSYNAPAIAPLAECKSNWEVSQLLAQEMGFDEPWLHQSTDEIITEILQNSRHNNPHLAEITLARLKAEGAIPYPLDSDIPFADGKFPTPSGKVELYCQALIKEGVDPLPTFVPAHDNSRPEDANGKLPNDAALKLICGASHHMVSSTFSNHPTALKHLRVPTIHIHPDDAATRHITTGDMVRVFNKRGSIELLAKVDQSVRPGVVSSDKGRWHKHSNGNNVNLLTSDALGDLAGQSTFHTNRVWLQAKVHKDQPHSTK